MTVLPSLKSFVMHPNAYRGAVVLTEQGFRSITTLACAVLVARACSPSAFAVYVLLNSIVLFAQGIQINLDGVPFTVLSGRVKKPKDYISGTVLQHLVSTLICAVILGPLAYLFCGTPEFPMTIALAICLCVYYASQATNQFVRYYFMARLACNKSFVIGIAYSVIALVLLAIWFGSGSHRLDIALLCMGTAFAGPLIAILFGEWRSSTWSFELAWKSFKTNVAFGRWLCIDGLIVFVTYQSYPWLLKHCDGGDAIARYGVCMGVCGLLSPITQSMGRLMFPLLVAASHKSSGELRRCVIFGLLLCVSIALPYLLIMVFFGDHLVSIMFGEKYSHPGPALLLFATSYAVDLCLVVIQYSVQAIGRPQFIPMSRMIGMCVTIVGAAAVLSHGLVGAGCCIILARLSQGLVLACLLVWRRQPGASDLAASSVSQENGLPSITGLTASRRHGRRGHFVKN